MKQKICFGDCIYTFQINIVEAEEDKSNLLDNIVELNDWSRQSLKEGKDKKISTYESAYALYEGRELTLNTFKSGIFPLPSIQGKGIKIWSSTQML